MRARERRWIYCPTAKYGAILRASLRPAVLHAAVQRETFISRSCSRAGVSPAVIRAEEKALSELNIPYFSRRIRKGMPVEPNRPSPELIQAMREAVELRGPQTNND